MDKHICETCGTQYPPSARPPARCAICEDERQYVGAGGQRWTTHEALLQRHEQRIEDNDGLLGLGVTPSFAIDQRALLLPTDAGNILWECTPLVTDAAVEALRARGGVDRIVISHPHFYSAMGEWSDALGGVPILLHADDQRWIQRPHPAIELWTGDELALSETVTLVRVGGHFQGSTVLHWADGPRPGGSLMSGDALQVVPTRRDVSFMYSYPNLIPMRSRDVVTMRERLAKLSFEDVYGYTWDRNIVGDGRAAVDRSFDRFLHAVGETASTKDRLRVVVLGATGDVGGRVAAEAQRRGHAVTGVVRSDSGLERLPPGVTGRVIDVRDTEGLATMLGEHDLAISAVRPREGEEVELPRLTRSVLDAAAQAHRRVLIVGGAANLLQPGGRGHTILSAPSLLPDEVRPIAAACFEQYMACTAHTGADWLYFSPPAMLTPGERTGAYRRGSDVLLVDPAGRSAISMEDFAVAMLDEAESPTRNVRRVTVAY